MAVTKWGIPAAVGCDGAEIGKCRVAGNETGEVDIYLRRYGRTRGLSVHVKRSPPNPARQPQQSSRSGLAPIDHRGFARKAGEIIAKAVESAGQEARRRRKGK